MVEKSNLQKIKEALPEGWLMVNGHESHGSRGSTGVAVIVRLPDDRGAVAQAPEELQRETYKAYNQAEQALEKYLTKTSPDFEDTRSKIREELLSCFGDEAIFAKEVPNGYWGDAAYALESPWFIVTTRIGHIRIGWRKRVVEIEFSESLVKLTAEEMFPDEDVTKHDKVVHAWGLSKAMQYVKALHDAVDAKKKEEAQTV
jgi:hypothetical protein